MAKKCIKALLGIKRRNDLHCSGNSNSITVFRHYTTHAQSFTAAKESAAIIAVALPAQILQQQ